MKKIIDVLKNEPEYRLKQIKKAIFLDLIESWEKATTLSKDLRQKLAEVYPIPELKIKKLLESKDGQTSKALFLLKDGFKIESVLMKHNDGRKTVCVSSQAGCAMGCSFCATGQRGFKRNLTSVEIVAQVLFFARLLKNKLNEVQPRTICRPEKAQPEENSGKISNVVFMGMGEPFLNYDNVIKAIKILNDKDGFNLGARHISISTCGVLEGIKKLSEEPLQVNLAVSLHAPNNELRTKLMPINKKYPIEKIISEIDNYIKKTKRRVMFEYLMIDGVNDGQKEANELVKIAKKPLYIVNLISFNPAGHSEFKSPPGFKIKQFKDILQKGGVLATQRYRFGKEIKAACGQLAGE